MSLCCTRERAKGLLKEGHCANKAILLLLMYETGYMKSFDPAISLLE
uniref:Uncharacterized protein n=1 Tax=Anguilla anguilla TaxID=7936 RepID=A0A0E9UQ37_ANGAN